MSAIRSNVDVVELNRQFLSAQRLRCTEFLQRPYAEALQKCLEEDVDWTVMLVEHNRIKELSREPCGAIQADRTHLAQKAYESAGRGYSFYFESNRRTSSEGDGGQRVREPLPRLLQEFQAQLNSAGGLQFFRQVTSISEIARTELMATRFGPGHFLAAHDDTAAHRKAAFVVNLTSNWKPTWGGLLHFFSAGGQVVDTYVPEFNTLHLFGVPQIHSVSFVAPFAQQPRYAISGWLYTA